MSATFRLREAPDHRFLPHVRLDFQPRPAANPLPIAAVRFFGDDSLETLFLDGSEEGYPLLGNVLAQVNVRQAFDQLSENFLAAQQRELFQVVAVEVKQIKDHVDER